MAPILRINDLRKTYKGGFEALKGVTLDIEEGEILALLGPNGAGKTTLISTICGITVPTSGTAVVAGHDTVIDYRKARDLIGLVPQEINLDPFETVWNTVRLTRGLFGKRRDDALLEKILRRLSLWDKKSSRIKELSGGMKRRVLIAKALDPYNLRKPGTGSGSGFGNHGARCAARAGADLEYKDRNRETVARSHRERAFLGNSGGASDGRQPCTLEGQLIRNPAQTFQDFKGR